MDEQLSNAYFSALLGTGRLVENYEYVAFFG